MNETDPAMLILGLLFWAEPVARERYVGFCLISTLGFNEFLLPECAPMADAVLHDGCHPSFSSIPADSFPSCIE